MRKKIFINTFILFLSGNVFAQTTVENLGNLVNSAYHEVRPTISADGKILYFVVEGNPANSRYKTDKKAQDIWYAELDTDGKWKQAVHAGGAFNDQKENAVFWVAPDGNRLLIRGAYENGKYVGRGVSMVEKTASGWSQPQKLKIKDYDNMSRDIYSGAFLSNDGKTLLLYFSEEKNSFVNDIYVSRLTENDDWTRPESLGEAINSDDYDELSPSLAADNTTLYFSSDRPGGFGEHDIWMSKRLDDSWKKWSEPVNMGDTINTAKWDAYFALDANGEYAYLSTTQNSLGGTDLAKIKLNEAQRPKMVVLVYGQVFNALTKQPMDAKLFYDQIPGETNEGNSISSPDGNYKLTLPYGKKYSIRASADNFFPVLDTLDIVKPGGYKEIHRDLYLYPVDSGRFANNVRRDLDSLESGLDDKPLEEGNIVSVNNILFDFAKAILRSESYPELDKVVRMLKANPTMQIELSAHTDKIGGYSKNLLLSNDRAYASREYLISKGISESRIKSKGYGEVKPIATNNTAEGRQLNRRVEFQILKK
jgi:outer membrane protein OmpA-like peptidoglycan-associated protein